MKRQTLSIMLIIFGVIALFTSFVDYYTFIIPLNLKSPEWINEICQQISGMAIVPLLGILTIFIGLFLSKVTHNSPLKVISIKFLSVLSLIVGIMFVFSTVMYDLSMPKVEKNAINAVKQQGDVLKQRVTKLYQANKYKITPASYNKYMSKLDSNLLDKVVMINSTYEKINIKIMFNLILFALAYILIGFLGLFPNGIRINNKNATQS